VTLSPEQLADWAAIHDLLARYVHTFDGGDADGWADCFVADGVLVAGDTAYRGHAAMRDYAEGSRSRPRHHHLLANVAIELGEDGTSAQAKSYVFYYEDAEGASVHRITGVQQDALVKIGGEWRITRRTVQLDSGAGHEH
jgi:3-phenylpropionate/cinnamic acid dioxygenase small subunit